MLYQSYYKRRVSRYRLEIVKRPKARKVVRINCFGCVEPVAQMPASGSVVVVRASSTVVKIHNTRLACATQKDFTSALS